MTRANKSCGGPEWDGKRDPSPSRRVSGFPLDLTIVTEINRALDPNVKLVRAPSIPTHWAHGVPIGSDPAPTRPPSAPEVDRTDISDGETFARQRPLIGDSLDDEQWSDDLQPHQKTMFEDRRALGKIGTNLGLSEGGEENIRNMAFRTPRSDK